MTADPVFESVLAPYIISLLELKRSCGYKYVAQTGPLKRFDIFCQNRGLKEPILTRELFEAWSERLSTESSSGQIQRIIPVRQLALHMISLGMKAYCPHITIKHEFNVPYIPNAEEVLMLLEVADNYKSKLICYSYMESGYRLALRMMYGCGMRLSECCDMRIRDVSVVDGTFIILDSKNNKDRLVYMADDLREHVEKHLWRLNRKYKICTPWLLPGSKPIKHLHKTSMDKKFNEFWCKTPYAKLHARHPTCHSLRHSFVVERVNSWTKQGVNINQMMAYLSSYLGHNTIKETMYYYHQVKEAFEVVHKVDSIAPSVIPEVI
jgi:integrase